LKPSISKLGTEDSLANTKVTVFNNGPIKLEGEFELVDQTGKAFGLGGRSAVSVCRCGHSGNQPFCDGSHKRQSFTNSVEARDLPPPAPKASV
jgi:CDGSH-type Zn-finger protein